MCPSRSPKTAIKARGQRGGKYRSMEVIGGGTALRCSVFEHVKTRWHHPQPRRQLGNMNPTALSSSLNAHDDSCLNPGTQRITCF